MHFEARELKICEGCGSLWVRCTTVMDVYCSRCVKKLAHYPLVGSQRRAGRKRKMLFLVQGGAQ